MSKVKQPYKSRPKRSYDICPVCKEINGDYRIIHKDANGKPYCLGCRKRDAMCALHEDQR